MGSRIVSPNHRMRVGTYRSGDNPDAVAGLSGDLR